jgi:hypothetical protein
MAFQAVPGWHSDLVSTPRRAILACVAGAHFVLGALFIGQRAVMQPVLPVATSLLAYVAPSRPVAPPPMIFADVAVEAKPPVIVVTELIAGPCSPLTAIEAALKAEPAVRSAIMTVPATTRSVADAIVVWNSDWAPVAATSDAPLGIVYDVVKNTLDMVPLQCLDEPIVGPRLILIDTINGTNVLAFGSGVWRWSDLVSTINTLK